MSDLNARTPPGADVIQRSDLTPAFSSNLLEHVLRRDNLQAAWKRVRANKGATSIDGMTIDELPPWAKSGHWSQVTSALATGRYTPSPVRRIEIDKPEGGKRQLGIPTACDRVIQQAIARMAYWRQWRKPRTKVRNLLRLGVHIRSAVACGITSKGPWRSAKTPGINQALSNGYLKSQGLFELRDGWIKLHHS